jgi:glycosyltransferase involved in cell wall biosynthesis
MNKSKMRILFITNMYPTRINPVFGIFVKEQVDDISRALQQAFEVFFINARYKGNLQYLLSILKIPLLLWKKKYDIIHIHYGFSGLFLLFFRPKAKVFLTLHGADILVRQGRYMQVWVTKKIIPRVDKVYILNKEMEEIVKPLNQNYALLPCGVNTDFFKPDNNKKTSGNVKTILFSNNPEIKVKNFPLFEKTIQLLDRQTAYKIEYRCISNLSREEVRDLYNHADCLLMTSTSEGSPQVVKEALACDLPVVSVPVGDVPVVTKGIPNCYISESYRAEELSKLVLKALEVDRTKTFPIREALLEKGKYDHQSVTQRLVANYRSVVHSGHIDVVSKMQKA